MYVFYYTARNPHILQYFSRPRHRTPLEERQMQETISAIRLRARYHDPYEEWEKQTRRDAFVSPLKH